MFVGQGKIRLQLNGLVIIGQRTFEIALRLLQNAPIVIGLSKFRPKLDCLVVIVNYSRQVMWIFRQTTLCEPPFVVSLWIVRFDFNGLAEVFDRTTISKEDF